MWEAYDSSRRRKATNLAGSPLTTIMPRESGPKAASRDAKSTVPVLDCRDSELEREGDKRT